MDENKILGAFGCNLRKIRLEKKMTQEALALEASLDRTYISSVERGKRNISLINIFRIACALNISVTDLLSFQVEKGQNCVK